MSETRKLAAILVSDVVGYSRLAGRDEELTLARLRALRSDLIDPIIAVHRGRVVKRTGDGAIVEFRSVVDAVRCAIEVQNGIIERNIGVPPERRIEFRIGIHLGDVMEESDGDLMGDGVNIAARLQSICAPNGICLSEQAYWQVKSRLDLAVTDLGDKELKNIVDPVRVYSLTVGVPAQAKPATPATVPKRTRGKLLIPAVSGLAVLLVIVAVAAWYFLVRPGAERVANAPAHLSIVVLPFANLSNDPKQDYFADGITDNLTTDLSRIRNSFVIARNTAFTYKGKNVDAKEIGKELGVRYVLEGSVQRDGNRVRVNAQLIDSESGAHLWADRFEEDLADLFKLQDDVVARLANTLGYELVKAEAEKSAHSRNPDAIDLTMQGWATVNQARRSKENDMAGRALFERALKLDPNNVDALVGDAYADTEDIIYGWADPAIHQDRRAENFLVRALEIDPTNANAYAIRGTLFMGMKRTEDAREAAEKALSLDPNFARAFGTLSQAQSSLNDNDRAIANIEQAMKLSPHDPLLGNWHFIKAKSLLNTRRYSGAVQELHAAIDGGFSNFAGYGFLAAALALDGQQAEAEAALAQSRKLNPRFTIKWLRARFDDPEVLYEGLRKAGLPEDSAPPPPKHLSIVVLPFTNLSGDPKQDYFADGITENLTTDMSRSIHGAFVIARNTAFTFKGKNVDAKEIGKELDVRYVLEGSVQRDGDRVRVNAQLIDAESGAHLWADRFDDDLADLFKLQDEVVARLARALQVELAVAESYTKAQNPDAIDLTLRGWALVWQPNLTKEVIAAAQTDFEQAAKLDPNNDDALAGIAYIHMTQFAYGWASHKDDYDVKILVPANRAIELNQGNDKAYYAKGIYLFLTKRADEALRVADTGLARDPNSTLLLSARSGAETGTGHYDRGKADIEQAMRLSPRDPRMGWFHMNLGLAEMGLRHFDNSIAEEQNAIDNGYRTFIPYAHLAASYAMLGRLEEAKQALAEARRLNPLLTMRWLLDHSPNVPVLYEGLRKAGLPEDEGPRLSIVVLPFQNLSGDAKQDYLADVLTDELTTYISRIPGSFVIARNTGFTYKGKPTDAKEIGKELGVRYMLEGSVQPTDKRIRTNAQLIDTETGAHLWAEEFDNEKTDLLETEDEIVTRLARTLDVQLIEVEGARAGRTRAANPDAQDLALRCQYEGLKSRFVGKEAEAGLHLCRKALESDPNNVAALTNLTLGLIRHVGDAQSSNRLVELSEADEFASRAIAIDANSPNAHVALARVRILQRRWDEGRTEAQRAIALSPSEMDAYTSLCQVALFTGQLDQVTANSDKALRLSPNDPLRFAWIAFKGWADFFAGREEQAVEWFRRSLAENPKYEFVQAWLASSLALTGHDAAARDALNRYLSLSTAKSRTIADFKRQPNSDNAAYLAGRERFYEGLRKAGMPEQ